MHTDLKSATLHSAVDDQDMNLDIYKKFKFASFKFE